MLTEELKRYKKKIGEITGKNLALDRLETYIGECPDRRTEIMKLAWLLGTDECRKKRGWNDLARKFFENFRPEILTWCGFDQVNPWEERVPVSDRIFFSDLFGEMKIYYFNDVSFDFLAERFYSCFRLEGTVGAFCTEMKEHNSGYSDCIKHFLDEINEINKKNRK